MELPSRAIQIRLLVEFVEVIGMEDEISSGKKIHDEDDGGGTVADELQQQMGGVGGGVEEGK